MTSVEQNIDFLKSYLVTAVKYEMDRVLLVVCAEENVSHSYPSIMLGIQFNIIQCAASKMGKCRRVGQTFPVALRGHLTFYVLETWYWNIFGLFKTIFWICPLFFSFISCCIKGTLDTLAGNSILQLDVKHFSWLIHFLVMSRHD